MNKQRKFIMHRNICMQKAVNQLCVTVCAFLFVTFLYDFIVNKNNLINYPFILPGLICFILLVYIINLFAAKKKSYLLCLLVTTSVSAGISLMYNFNPFAVISSLSTLILLILFLGILLPLNIKESIFLFSLVWVSYLIPVFLYINNYEEAAVGRNSIFIITSIILAVIWSKNNFKQRKRIWILNQYCTSMKQKIKSGDNGKDTKKHKEQISKTERAAFINQVISSFVHDLNNFLTIILGKSYLIHDSLPEEDENQEHIEAISKTCQKASSLIRKLLTVSNGRSSHPCKKNLNEIINEVKDMVNYTISNNIDLIIKEAPELHLVKVDPLHIEQILLNLCINARDAMPGGGSLILETSNVNLDEMYCTSRNLSLTPGKYVMVAISDTGTGINKNIKSQIFKPFFTTKDKDSGTGLGLSSVYKIIKENKGDILMYTEEGKGTVFKLFFPAYNSVPVRSYNTSRLTKTKTVSDTLPNQETILVVDDNVSILHMTSCMLRSHGFKVLEAKNSGQALSLVDKFNTKIDLILSDVVLPEESGKTLYEKIRKRYPGIGILYTSGFTSYLLRHYALLDNDNDLIQKPFTTLELINKVKESLKKKKQKIDKQQFFYKGKLMYTDLMTDQLKRKLK